MVWVKGGSQQVEKFSYIQPTLPLGMLIKLFLGSFAAAWILSWIVNQMAS
jgi:hypothetical protein